MIEKFTIGFARTKNLGNYESARVEASVTVIVGDKEQIVDLVKKAQEDLKQLLIDTWNAQYKPLKPTGEKP